MSNWRQEERERERDYAEREQYRMRARMSPEERAAEMAEQIASGELVIRTATAAERARYGMPSPDLVERDLLGPAAVITSLRSPNLSATQRAAREVAVAAAGVTAAELAAAARVSVRTVERAQRVRAADLELFERLIAGQISATAAAAEVSSR